MQAAEQDWLQQQVCGPLGLDLSDDQLQRLLGFIGLLQRWNATYNLTAVRDRAAMLTQHLADCLAVVPALHRFLATAVENKTPRLLDVGSGGGLPGTVLAIALPQLQVTTIDAVGKKAAFVRHVVGGLGLANLHALHGRVQALQAPPYDVVVSRAFATLADFVAQTRQHLAPGGVWMAMKGKQPLDEVAALASDIEVFHVEPLTVPGLDAERCLVWMRPRSASVNQATSQETA